MTTTDMGDFVTNIVSTLTSISPDWATWVIGAIALGGALKLGPRLVKRFM